MPVISLAALGAIAFVGYHLYYTPFMRQQWLYAVGALVIYWFSVSGLHSLLSRTSLLWDAAGVQYVLKQAGCGLQAVCSTSSVACPWWGLTTASVRACCSCQARVGARWRASANQLAPFRVAVQHCTILSDCRSIGSGRVHHGHALHYSRSGHRRADYNRSQGSLLTCFGLARRRMLVILFMAPADQGCQHAARPCVWTDLACRHGLQVGQCWRGCLAPPGQCLANDSRRSLSMMHSQNGDGKPPVENRHAH